MKFRTMLAAFVMGAVSLPAYADEISVVPDDGSALVASPTQIDATSFKRYRLKPNESIQDMERRYKREFNISRYVGWAMAVADIASTQRCLHKNTCHEGNPIYLSKRPSTLQMVAIRLPLEIVMDAALRKVFKRDPETAIRIVQIKAGLTGVAVGLNMRY